MADFVLKYADGRGQIHQQVATAASEKELRDKYSPAGIPDLFDQAAGPPRLALASLRFVGGTQEAEPREVPDLQPAVRHADPRRTADPERPGPAGRAPHRPKLGPYIKAVRDEVRNGTLLSEAFRQQGIFPKIYVTSVMAGEKSGSLTEVLDRYISYQKLGAGGAQEGHGFADVSVRADRAGDPADGLPGDLRGAQLRRPVQQHAGEAAGHDASADRGRHRGAKLHRVLRGGSDRRPIFSVPLVGTARVGAEDDRPGQAAHCRSSARSG